MIKHQRPRFATGGVLDLYPASPTNRITGFDGMQRMGAPAFDASLFVEDAPAAQLPQGAAKPSVTSMSSPAIPAAPKPGGFAMTNPNQSANPNQSFQPGVLGYAAGGIVKGKGTTTSDSIPVNLSKGEAVLPAKTVKALGGKSMVERLIEMTNGKPPVKGGIHAGGNYKDGYLDMKKLTAEASAQEAERKAAPLPAWQQANVERAAVNNIPAIVANSDNATTEDALIQVNQPSAPQFAGQTPAAPASAQQAQTQPAPNPAQSKITDLASPNIASLRTAGVTGAVGGDNPEWRADAGGNFYQATPRTGIRTLETPNGTVYAGRDAKGQLNIVSNLDKSAGELEAGRAKEAARMENEGARIARNRIASLEIDLRNPELNQNAKREAATALEQMRANQDSATRQQQVQATQEMEQKKLGIDQLLAEETIRKSKDPQSRIADLAKIAEVHLKTLDSMGATDADKEAARQGMASVSKAVSALTGQNATAQQAMPALSDYAKAYLLKKPGTDLAKIKADYEELNRRRTTGAK